jgi:hypothetical protein
MTASTGSIADRCAFTGITRGTMILFHTPARRRRRPLKCCQEIN